MLKYIHGSADSTDVDVMYIFNEIPAREDATRFCSDNSIENKNIAVVRDGVVVWVYKGTVDEVNNALLRTIPLHDNPECIITSPLERDILAKTIRVMRGSLTQCSRTEYRTTVKEATTSYSWKKRMQAFRHIHFWDIEDFGKQDRVETLKFFAFQWGQLAGLALGKELYTKAEVAEMFPSVRKFLYREPSEFLEGLQDVYFIARQFMGSLEVEEGADYCRFVDFDRTYDLKKEVEIR